MIVWDKGTPGMGVGWRSQHELILLGLRISQPFDLRKGHGNVIQAKRTGNQHHPTEKPVELVVKVLEVTDIARSVYDPFAGSGTTMVGAEQTGRVAYGMEIDPAYTAVALERLAGMGLEPRLADG
jgi:DNA modification methylase